MASCSMLLAIITVCAVSHFLRVSTEARLPSGSLFEECLIISFDDLKLQLYAVHIHRALLYAKTLEAIPPESRLS